MIEPIEEEVIEHPKESLEHEEEDPIGWISRAERYFRYHKTADASMVEIVAIHLEGDAILTSLNTLMESFHGDNSKKDC